MKTDIEIRMKQLYLYFMSQLVVDLINKKMENEDYKEDKEHNKYFNIESEELQKLGVITNGYGIRVYPNYLYESKDSPKGGATHPQIVTGCNYAFISIREGRKSFEKKLMHEVIHALDCIGNYDFKDKASKTNPGKETPDTLIDKYGSNSKIKYPTCCSHDLIEDTLYKCDPMEFYALMANAYHKIKECLSEMEFYTHDDIWQYLHDKYKYIAIQSRKDILDKIRNSIRKASKPCKENLCTDFSLQLMYCIQQNTSDDSFTFPNYIPNKYSNPEDIFKMDVMTYQVALVKTYEYLSRVDKLFNEMVHFIIEDCLKNKK